MEVFFDFGLFELASALFLALLTRWVFRRRLTAIPFLLIAVAAPSAALLFVPRAPKSIAALTLATSFVNASALAMIVAYCPEAFDIAVARGLAMAERAFPRVVHSNAFQYVRRLLTPKPN